MKETPWGTWDPLSLAEVCELFRGCPVTWWISGGYALEVFAGRSWREHDDIDVALFREDQRVVRDWIEAWDAHAGDPPGTLRPWKRGDTLPLGAHDIWVRQPDGGPWRFQLMLDESRLVDGERAWTYRRDERIARPASMLTLERDGVRVLQPEVQLLYKAKGLREKDQRDFEEVAPLLDEHRRAWLREGLALTLPGHAWLAKL